MTSLDFDDWDDMPDKLLLQRNAAWLGGHLAYRLMPTYSIAQTVAGLIDSRAESSQLCGNIPEFSKRVIGRLPSCR